MRLHKIALITALFGFLPFLAAPAVSQDLGMIRLSLIEGDIQVMIKDSTDWIDAGENLPMSEGDRLWVAEGSRAELQVRGGVSVRLDGSTSLDILTSTGDSAQFYLDRGHAYVNNRRGGIQIVQIDTAQSSVRSYDNSIMLVDAFDDDSIEVSMLKGFSYVENRAGVTRVSSGNALTVRDDSGADLAPIGLPDEWERWNTDRDRIYYAGGESNRYLPDELHEYATDLDNNGRWDYSAEYGYVWTPTVVDPEWAPYTVGSWIWIRGQYVWIAQDRWCWAPSHYGRWVSTSWGWSWVPPAIGAVYWGPGFVGWISTPTYVAWVPLAPGEIYYGHGYYGPWSRNINTVNVNTLIVNRNYINTRGRNSVVVVEKDSFGTGRHRPLRLKDNPFLDRQHHQKDDRVALPPTIKPHHPIVITDRDNRDQRRHDERERPSREGIEKRQGNRTIPPTVGGKGEHFGNSKTTPQPNVQQPIVKRQLPPERFRNIRPEDVKNERRIVRERDASVFKAHPPENLPVKKLNEPRESTRKVERKPQVQKENRPNHSEGKERRQDR